MYESIQEKADYYLQVQQAIAQFRQQWEKHTRQSIIDALRDITGKVTLDWRVEENKTLENSQRVSLTFGYLIRVHEQGGKVMFMEEGTLLFNQVYDGRIAVTIKYPKIEIRHYKYSSKELGYFEPQEIDQAKVAHLVEQFLEAITNWETMKLGHEQD